jgi:hypothetical protein
MVNPIRKKVKSIIKKHGERVLFEKLSKKTLSSLKRNISKDLDTLNLANYKLSLSDATHPIVHGSISYRVKPTDKTYIILDFEISEIKK